MKNKRKCIYDRLLHITDQQCAVLRYLTGVQSDWMIGAEIIYPGVLWIDFLLTERLNESILNMSRYVTSNALRIATRYADLW